MAQAHKYLLTFQITLKNLTHSLNEISKLMWCNWHHNLTTIISAQLYRLMLWWWWIVIKNQSLLSEHLLPLYPSLTSLVLCFITFYLSHRFGLICHLPVLFPVMFPLFPHSLRSLFKIFCVQTTLTQLPGIGTSMTSWPLQRVACVNVMCCAWI